MGLGDVISVKVTDCVSTYFECGSATGPYVQLIDANAVVGEITTLAQDPLDLNHPQILLELTHPTAGSDKVYGYYAYVDNGVEGSLNPLGSYDDLFTGPGTVGYTQTGIAQLTPVP